MAKLFFTNHILGFTILHLFNTTLLLAITNIIPFSLIKHCTYAILYELTDTDSKLPSDDPNFTNLMDSHFDCEKQHILRQFNLLNVKQWTEATSNIQHANVNARFYVRAKGTVKAFMCETYKKKRKIFFKVQFNADVLTELFGIITQCNFLLHLTL